MAKTVADQLAKLLATAGVKRIYGIVGGSLKGITDAIRRQSKIERAHVRHDEVAAFAAGAEARLTGELALCVGSSGPGNLHLTNVCSVAGMPYTGLRDAIIAHPTLAEGPVTLFSNVPESSA